MSYKIDSSEEPMSRYRKYFRITDSNGNEIIESYNRVEIVESDGDIYHKVKVSEVNRLDLIAYNYYGTSMLWWVIAEASNIINPFNVPVGTVLRIPPLVMLYGEGGVLK